MTGGLLTLEIGLTVWSLFVGGGSIGYALAVLHHSRDKEQQR